LLLAFAGAHRMEYDHLIRHELSLDEFIPAVGQGSIAAEASVDLDPKLKHIIEDAVHHLSTGYRLKAERSYLKVLEGGCSIPVYALAVVDGEKIRMKGGIVSLDGSNRIVHEVTGNYEGAVELGQQLAHKVLKS